MSAEYTPKHSINNMVKRISGHQVSLEFLDILGSTAEDKKLNNMVTVLF